MTPERWQEARRLYHACIEADAQERARLLDAECAADEELRAEVQSLLEIADSGGSFMATPAVEGSFDVPQVQSWVGRRLGAYEILAPLGEGGMGKVFRAVRADGQYRQEVAIKLVRPGLEGEFTLAKFKAERQILASLEHPNIARLLDGGITTEGMPYFVMELVDGEPIDRYCDGHNLSIPQRLELFCEVCAAVQYAHQRLTVHRDLKPGNILVTADGVVKLLDFGIAKVLGDGSATSATIHDVRAMTLEYSSPEQIKGEPATTATDIYSLGVVLFRLLTRQSPYRTIAGEPFTLAREVCETEPPKPSSAIAQSAGVTGRKHLEGDLDCIVMMALRKEPHRRYASAAQFADDIRAHLAHKPVAARPSTWTYHASRFIARNRIAVAAATLAVVAVIGGLVSTVWEARIAVAERDRAERHFSEVRKLAKAMIFDLHDAIADLPGATPARKLLIDKALGYLDGLSREVADDLGLQRELAGAYARLGDVQGNFAAGNLGDSGAALASYRKALSLREAVAAARPESRDDQVALANVCMRVGGIDRDGNELTQRLGQIGRAASILESLSVSHPDDEAILEALAGAYQTTAHLQGGSGVRPNLGDTASALANIRKSAAIRERLLRAKPADAERLGALATSLLNIGELLVKQGDRAGAVVSYRKALGLLESSPAATSNAKFTNWTLGAHEFIGNAQIMDGDSQGAIANYRQSVAIAKNMATADPSNARARFLVAIQTALLGNALAISGRRDEGRELLRQAIEHAETEVAHDPRMSMAQHILALAHVFRGRLRRTSADLDGAAADYRKAEDIFAAITSKDANDIQARLLLAGIRGKLADILASQRRWQDADEHYQQALSAAQPLAQAKFPNLQAQYTVADAYSGMGASLMVQAADKHLPAAQRTEYLKQARSNLEQSLAVWRQVPNPGILSPLGIDTSGPGAVQKQLAQCEASIRALTPEHELAA